MSWCAEHECPSLACDWLHQPDEPAAPNPELRKLMSDPDAARRYRAVNDYPESAGGPGWRAYPFAVTVAVLLVFVVGYVIGRWGH